MEAQHNLAKVLRQVEEGQGVYITRRKKVVAKIMPPGDPAKVRLPDFSARARKTWGKQWKGTSSDQLLDESRGSR